jgi:hypothetical protein
MPFRHKRRYYREAIGVFASAGSGGKFLRPSASVERSGRLIKINGINSAKNLIDPSTYTFEILRLKPQNDVVGQPLKSGFSGKILAGMASGLFNPTDKVPLLSRFFLTRILHEISGLKGSSNSVFTNHKKMADKQDQRCHW